MPLRTCDEIGTARCGTAPSKIVKPVFGVGAIWVLYFSCYLQVSRTARFSIGGISAVAAVEGPKNRSDDPKECS